MNERIRTLILERLEAGEDLCSICGGEGMPAEAAVRSFLNGPWPAQIAFRQAFGWIIWLRRISLMEDILDLARDRRNDWVQVLNENGEPYVVLDRSNIRKARLQIKELQRRVAALEAAYPEFIHPFSNPASLTINIIDFSDIPEGARPPPLPGRGRNDAHG